MAARQTGSSSINLKKDILYVYPGLAPQWSRMGWDLYEGESIFRSALDQFDRLFQEKSGWSLIEEISRPEAESRLKQAFYGYPATISVEIALHALLLEYGFPPAGVIGHSGGEVAAAYAARLISLEDAVQLVWGYCCLIEKIEGQGLLAHISAEPHEAANWINREGLDVSVAGYNSPRATLLAGEAADVQKAVDYYSRQNVFARVLSAGVPFHSRFIEPYLDLLFSHFKNVSARSSETAFYSTVFGSRRQAHSLTPHYWVIEPREPVLFHDAVNAAIDDGFRNFLEVSPHAIMTLFIEEALQDRGIKDYRVIPSLTRGENGAENFKSCLNALKEIQGTQADNIAAGFPHSAVQRQGEDTLSHSKSGEDTLSHSKSGEDTLSHSKLSEGAISAAKSVSLEEIRRQLLAMVQTILPDFQADADALDRGFLQMGFTSVMAIGLQKQLGEHFQLSLPVTLAFDYPTINLASEYIHGLLTGGERSRITKPQSVDFGSSQAAKEPLAVIGLSCRMPGGGNSAEEFWNFLINRGDSAQEIPPERWNMAKYYSENPDEPGKSQTRMANFLSGFNFKSFDASLFNVTPKEALSLDPQQRWLLETSWEALENAAIPAHELRGKNVGVYLGFVSDDYQGRHLWSSQFKTVDVYSASGSMPSSAGGRLSYFYGFQGPNITVDTACSSSLVSLHLAVQGLRTGDCDLALAAGVNALFVPNLFIGFTKLGVLSRDGRCKTFDASADGYGRSEGCGVVILKRLSDAVRDGNIIHAVIMGSAVNQDGASSSFTAPSGPAQQAVIRRAFANAGITPDQIDFVEAHGTGTVLGDAIELNALDSVFRERKLPGKVYVGSVKTNIGHSEGAAGIAGTIKTILVLKHKQLPPHLHFKNPTPQFDWEKSNLTVATEVTPLIEDGRPKMGCLSSYGFSGTNAHAVICEAPKRPPRIANDIDRSFHALMISARESRALIELAQRYRDFFASKPEADLGDVCYTAAIGRTHFNNRLAVVGQNSSEMIARLDEFLKNPASRNVISDKIKSKPPELVFLYSGQGSQYPGMAKELYQSHPTFRASLDALDKLFLPHLNESLVEIFFNPEKGELINRTDLTQPAIFALQVALTDLWAEWGVHPTAVAGHSIGEYAAAVAAGIFSVEDAVRLVAARGRLMHHAPGKGAMGVVFAPLEEVEEQVARFSSQASVAAVNAPGTITISGDEHCVDDILAYFKEKGVRSQRLVVSHAFHSPLMHPVLDEFRATASSVRYSEPQIRFFSCLTGVPETAVLTTADYWTSHIAKPVEFMKGFQALEGDGFDLFLEIGGDTTLSGLGKRCQQREDTIILPTLRKKESDWSCLLRTLGTLYTKGASFDARGFDQPYSREKVVLPTYPFQRREFWMEDPNQVDLGVVSGALPVVRSQLGEELTSPALQGVRIFTNSASPKTHQFLSDHLIAGRILYPGAAMLSQIHAALKRLYGLDCGTLQDISFTNLLKMNEDSIHDTQLILRENADVTRIQFASRNARQPNEPWIIHSEGYFRKYENRQAELIEPLGGDSSDVEKNDMDHFYSLMHNAGYNFGPSFKLIKEISIGKELTFSRVEMQDEVKDGLEYELYPGLVDSLTVSTVAIGARPQLYEQLKKQSQVILPYTIDRVQVYRDFPKEIRCVSNIKFLSDRLISNADFLDIEGNMIASIRGFHGKYVDTLVIRRLDHSEMNKFFHVVDWVEHRRSEEAAAVDKHSWLIIGKTGSGLKTDLAAKLGSGGHQALTFDLEAVNEAQSLRELISKAHPQRIAIVDPVDAQLTDGIYRRLNQYLETVKAISGARWSGRIYWITQGAQPDATQGANLNYASASIAGVVLSVEKEFPEFINTCVDMPLAPSAGEIDYLINEIDSDHPFNQITIRGAHQAGAQLTSAHLARKEDVVLPENGSPFELSIQSRGTFQGLIAKPSSARKPGRGEVRVRIHAAGLNFRDVLNLLGEYPGDAGKPGLEAVGYVESVGPDLPQDGDALQRFKPGDRVMVVGVDGLFASEVVVNRSNVIGIPGNLTFNEAATIGTVFSTVYYGLHFLAELKKGESILIHAGAGGVGMAAIQLAKLAGARIFATAGSEEKRDFLRRMGVEHVFSSRTLDFADHIMDITKGEGIDVVLNSLAGDFIPKSLLILKSNGRFIELGKKSWTNKEITDLKPGVKFHQFDLMSTFGVRSELVSEVMGKILASFASGDLKPLPCRVFPCAKARDAFKYMAQARHIGKIVLSFDDHLRRAQIAREGLFRKDASYLITGGTGGLGLKMVDWMIENGAGTMVLTGRKQEDQLTMDLVLLSQEKSASILYRQCDISRQAEVARLMEEISRSLPPLKGVFHLAGVLDDGLINDQSPAKFAKVLDPKVKGGQYLHEATVGLDLDYFVLFSSLAAVLGNAGQTNYSAANRFLDGLAEFRRLNGLPAISINWGPWEEVGMAAASVKRGDRLAEMGLKGLSPEVCLAALEKILRDDPVNITVADIDWSRYARTFSERDMAGFFKLVQQSAAKGSQPEHKKADKVNVKETLSKASPGERRRMLLEKVLQTVSGVIGFIDADSFDLDQPLTNQGFDSLMAVELRNQLGQELEVSLPVSLLFDYPTVNEINRFLLEDVLELAEERKELQTAEPESEPTGLDLSAEDILSNIEKLIEKSGD